MYSLRDSIIRPEELVSRLKEINQMSAAITDHGTSLGGVSIYKLFKSNGLKYIHGCEVYICDDVSIKDKDNKYYHLVLLCLNEQGRLNLNKIISESGRPENTYYKPRIDFDILQKYKDGIVVLSACLAGEISRWILTDYERAKAIAKKYQAEFGEKYYLEIQSRDDKSQIEVNKEIVKLAKELNIQLVTTTDAHFVYKDDRKYQNKYAFNGSYKEDGESYVDCYVQSESDVREKLSYLPQEIVDKAISNTDLIASMCNVEMPLSAPIMPKVDTPLEYKDNKEWLETLCRQGFRNKLNFDLDSLETIDKTKTYASYNDEGEYIGEVSLDYSKEIKQKYVDRYYYELNALDKMGFIDYILLVYSYANVGKRRGIARGSGGGSLINYVTNITDIDPIEHGLYFERFIDVGALDLLERGEITAKELKIPDIDLDFSNNSCKEVLRWLYNRYGESRVASIGKFGTNQTKGTIRDMCKVLDISLETADTIAKCFENYEIDEVIAMIDGSNPVENGAKEAIKCVKEYPELFDYVKKLNGLPKSFGLHACGKVIATRDLDDFLPSSYDKEGIRYLQGDMHDVEDVGLVKIDVLGLRTLDQEYDTLEMSNEKAEFISPKQNYSDPKVLSIFKNGDTVGIFQMASYGMKQTLKKMNVQGIEDLSIANALYRPGAMAYIDNFCKRRTGEEKFEYLNPDLEPILKNTYGIMVFQEQLIEIGRMAGLHNPDQLRKATGKKKPELLAQIKPELQEKLKARGWSEQQFEQLWSDMLEFAKYSFNKAHSSAYGIIAYLTAKQKAYYPVEFFAGLCNSYLGKSSFVKDNAREIMDDVADHNISLCDFDYTKDHRKCSNEDGKIRYAIPLIKDCSMQTAETLYAASHTKFSCFMEFLRYLANNGVPQNQIEILIKLGFFRQFGNSKELLKCCDMLSIFKGGEAKKVDKNKINNPTVEELVLKYCTDINSKGEKTDTITLTNSKMNVLKKQITLLKKNIKANKGNIQEQDDALTKITDEYNREYDLLMDSVLKECEKYILNSGISDFTYQEKAADSILYCGFVNLTTGKEEDRRKLLITSIVPLKNKQTGVPWAYAVFTRSIGSGKASRLTLRAKIFDQDPIKEKDIVYAKTVDKDKTGYWYLIDYYKVE